MARVETECTGKGEVMPSAKTCAACGAEVCERCGECMTQHNEDPVCNCPGTSGNPKPPQHRARPLSAKDLLKLSWAELCELDEFRAVVWKGLGEKGPWKHAFDWDHFCKERNPDDTRCSRCKGEWSNDISGKKPCPVPPPITDPVEVVARRLLERLKTWPLHATWLVWEMVGMPGFKTNRYGADIKWFAYNATPLRQIIVCLLALNLIGD